jgi:hypothetical protein
MEGQHASLSSLDRRISGLFFTWVSILLSVAEAPIELRVEYKNVCTMPTWR